MKNTCRCALMEYMVQRLAQLQQEAEQYPEELMQDPHVHKALECGENSCCTLTFMAYMTLCCKNTDDMIRDLRQLLQDIQDKETSAS